MLATQDFARRPQLWLSLISSSRATISYSPSFGYDLCTRREQSIAKAELDLSSWRIAGIGGDMIRPGVLSTFAKTFAPCGFGPTAFLPSYGMAEATLAISFAPVGRGIETDTIDLDRMEQDGIVQAPADGTARVRTVVLCGVALPGHEIAIRDADGTLLGERRVGRIYARGASVMEGYSGRPDETTINLSADGWLATGDLGYRLGETLVVTGRAKDLIIINGRNIWPQDLEWTVRTGIPRGQDRATWRRFRSKKTATRSSFSPSRREASPIRPRGAGWSMMSAARSCRSTGSTVASFCWHRAASATRPPAN